MATIRDVAKLSGVSIATVSHVLRGRDFRVAGPTRERVLAAVRELQYRPNGESGHASASTRTVAFMAGDVASPVFQNDYFARLFQGFVEGALVRGYSVTLLAERVWDEAGRSVRRSFDARSDGVAFLSPFVDNESLRSVVDRGFPAVVLGSTLNLPGVSTVDIDNEAAAYNATRHLLGLGHTRIAYLGAWQRTISSVERSQGYKRAMLESGRPSTDVCAVFGTGASEVEARRIQSRSTEPVHALIDRTFAVDGWVPDALDFVFTTGLPGCTAVICWNDTMGRQVAREAERRGLRVPDALSIVSFDDTTDAVSERPHLTTLRQPFALIGRTAATMLIDLVGDRSLPDQVVRFVPEIVVRESTGSPRPAVD